MVSVFRRFMMFFMGDRNLADSINDMKLMDAQRNIDALRPARAIKIIGLLDERKQQDICQWIGSDKVAGMFASNPPKVMQEIFSSFEEKMQLNLLRHMKPAKATKLLDQVSPVDRDFLLVSIERSSAGNIVSAWPPDRQQEVLAHLDFWEQMEIVASMEVKSIKKITADWKMQKVEKLFRKLSSAKFLGFLETFDSGIQVELLNRITPRKVAEVIEGLNSDDSVTILEKLSPPQIAGILGGMSEFAAAGILGGLSQEIQKVVLPVLSEKTVVAFLRKYTPEKRVPYLQWFDRVKVKAVLNEFDYAELKGLFKKMSPAEFVKFVMLLERENRENILTESDPELLAGILEHMEIKTQLGMLGYWDIQGQANIIEKMSNNIASRLVLGCKPEDRLEIFQVMKNDRAADILAPWGIKEKLFVFNHLEEKKKLADILKTWPSDVKDSILTQLSDEVKADIQLYL